MTTDLAETESRLYWSLALVRVVLGFGLGLQQGFGVGVELGLGLG